MIQSIKYSAISKDEIFRIYSIILIKRDRFYLSSNDEADNSDDEFIINDGIIYSNRCYKSLES